MEYGFIKTPKWLKIAIVIPIILILFLYKGCTPLEAILIRLVPPDPRAGQYPYLETSTWVCQEPYIRLEYAVSEDGSHEYQEFLEWNGEQIRIELQMQAAQFEVQPYHTVSGEDWMFLGRWKYRGEDLVLIIHEDRLFDNQFKELIFTRVG